MFPSFQSTVCPGQVSKSNKISGDSWNFLMLVLGPRLLYD